MLTVWGRRSSSNVQALMWCIGELNLPHERIDAGHRFGGTDTPGFVAMNPNRTVPVLRDGDGAPLWETGAILRYLANRYAAGTPFWPTDHAARANVDRWAEWAKLNIAMGFTGPVFWRVVRTAPRDRDWVGIRSAVDTFERVLRIAERRLRDHAWLAGTDFSLADIQFGHVLHRYYDIAIDRCPLPDVRRYYDRLTIRPAYAAHVMVP